MEFEVINRDGFPVMGCSSVVCIPTDSQLLSMSKEGYKFKINGKAVSLKKIKELKQVTTKSMEDDNNE